MKSARAEAYTHGAKTGQRAPLYTARVQRGMIAAAAIVPAFAMAENADIAAFVRYARNLDAFQRSKQP